MQTIITIIETNISNIIITPYLDMAVVPLVSYFSNLLVAVYSGIITNLNQSPELRIFAITGIVN